MRSRERPWAFLDRVRGDLEAPGLEAGDVLHHIVHEKPLGAADVQHLGLRVQAVPLRDFLNGLLPPAVVLVAAVALVAFAVEVVLPERVVQVPGPLRVIELRLGLRAEDVDEHRGAYPLTRSASSGN
jgi:hypothetical protein